MPRTPQDEKLVDVPSVLPMIDGREFSYLRIALGGAIELPLKVAEHRALLERLKLDTEAKVTLTIDGHPPIDLVGAITAHEEKMVKREKTHVGLLVRRVGVNRESSSWREEPAAA